jgi:hypothetical protein
VTVLTLSADDDARTDQRHAGDGHDQPTAIHRAPPYTGGRTDYTKHSVLSNCAESAEDVVASGPGCELGFNRADDVLELVEVAIV